jgi:hypothetical protein
MTTPADCSVEQLATRLLGPLTGDAKYDAYFASRRAQFVAGIRHEQERLGQHGYLLVVSNTLLDLDDSESHLYLCNAFDELTAARLAAPLEIERRNTAYINQPHLRQHTWIVDPYAGTWAPSVSMRSGIRIEDVASGSWTAGLGHRISWGASILGPFSGTIVGHQLLDALADSRHPLEAYFYCAG